MWKVIWVWGIPGSACSSETSWTHASSVRITRKILIAISLSYHLHDTSLSLNSYYYRKTFLLFTVSIRKKGFYLSFHPYNITLLCYFIKLEKFPAPFTIFWKEKELYYCEAIIKTLKVLYHEQEKIIKSYHLRWFCVWFIFYQIGWEKHHFSIRTYFFDIFIDMLIKNLSTHIRQR